MIKFNCPHCAKSIQVKDEYAGKSGKCPASGSAIRVPSAKQVTDDDVLDILGAPEKKPFAPTPPPPIAQSAPVLLTAADAPVAPPAPIRQSRMTTAQTVLLVVSLSVAAL